MALTVREQITAQIETLLDAVTGVTAYRPKKVHWTDEVTKHLTAVIRQGELRFVHEDATGATGTFVCEQDYAITLVIRESDAATTSYETETNRVMADLVEALAADIDLGNHAVYEGLRFDRITPEDPDEITGETLHVTVTFSTGRTNMETNLRGN